MRLTERNRIFDRLAPRADVLKRDRSRIDVAEYRLDVPPDAPPVLPRARGLACPLFGAAIAPERLAQGPSRVNRQHLGLLRRQVVGRRHGRRGGLTAFHRLPASIPLLGDSPCIGTILPARHAVETECAHVWPRFPETSPIAAHAVVGNLDLSGHVP